MANIVIIFKEGLIIMIAHGKKIKIFTGNSHPELAKEDYHLEILRYLLLAMEKYLLILMKL